MARIARFFEVGGPENIQVVDEEPGTPGDGEVLVNVKAAGLNRAEFLYLHGQYLVEPKLPSRIGVEGAGIIEAVGSNAGDWKVGDEVSITPNMSPDRYGVIGEYAIVPVAALAPKSPEQSFEQGSRHSRRSATSGQSNCGYFCGELKCRFAGNTDC